MEGIISGVISLVLNFQTDSYHVNHIAYTLSLVAIHAFITVGCLGSRRYARKESLTLILGFALRLALMLWDIFGRGIFVFPDAIDAYTYLLSTVSLYNGGGAGRGGMYSRFLYLVYLIFGPLPIMGQYINILLSMSMACALLKLMYRLKLDVRARYCALCLLCFMPYLAMDEVLLLREAIVHVPLAFSIYYFFIWFTEGGRRPFLMAFILPLVAAAFHSGAIAMELAYAITIVLYDPREGRFRLSPKSFLTVVALLAAFFVVNRFLGDSLFGKFNGVDSVSDVVGKANAYDAGGASYTIGSNTDSVGGLILYTPLRMLYFTASPMPWDWRGIKDILSFALSSVPYLYILLRGIIAMRKPDSENRLFLTVCLFMVFLGAALFAWGVSNAGAAMRHRDKFVAAYAMLLAFTLDDAARRKAETFETNEEPE